MKLYFMKFFNNLNKLNKLKAHKHLKKKTREKRVCIIMQESILINNMNNQILKEIK